MKPKHRKGAAILLLLGIVMSVFILVMRHRQSVERQEWFHDLNQRMDEYAKSNGLVKMGSNTWELQSKTNITASDTNK
jgi:hypothetical protein